MVLALTKENQGVSHSVSGGIVRFGLSEVILGMVQEIEVLLWLDTVRKWGQFYHWTSAGAKAIIGKEAAINPDRWERGTLDRFSGLRSDLVFLCAQTL